MSTRFLILTCILVAAPCWSQSDSHSDLLTAIVAITHVTVINPVSSKDQQDQTVVIVRDRIQRVGSSSAIHIPSSARILDARGKFLIPGLWDMHVHLSDPKMDFPLFIANGVLGVRNMGGVEQDVFRWRSQTASGELLGPKIVACGPILDGPTPSHPEHAISVHNPEEGRAAVDKLKADGADFIKVYDGLSRESYFAIAQEAKKVGLPFVGHVPGSIRASEASDAGQKSIEHLTGILEGAANNQDELTKANADHSAFEEAMKTHNFSLIPAHIAQVGDSELDHYSAAKAQKEYELFRKNGTWQDPTLVTARSLALIDDISKQQDARLKYIPSQLSEQWKPENGMLTRYRTPAYIAFRKREFEARLREVRLMHSMGVPFLAGTDATGAYIYPGFSLHDELRLLVQAGFTSREALVTATVNPARFFGTLPREGTVEQGKIANLVLLDRDPTTDINNIDAIAAVVYRGKIYDRAALDQLLAQAETHAKQSN